MVNIQQKTLEDLEFPTVLNQVSEFCITEAGKQAVLKIIPFKIPEDVAPEHLRLNEFKASFENENNIPNHGFDPIFNELKLLSIENSVIQPGGFRRIQGIATTVRSLQKFFKKFKEFYGSLFDFSGNITYDDSIAKSIMAVIDRYGEIKDDASDELKTIRKELRQVKSKIDSSFTKAVSHYGSLNFLDEIKETIVDNRRVLAVSAMHRKNVKGVVLGSSKTGSIVYMEPRETLEYANALTNLLFKEEEEIKRILRALTNQMRPHIPLLESFQNYLIYIDTLHARSRHALLINAEMPRFTEARRLFLKEAFHPLLLAFNTKIKAKTFPQTIELHDNCRIIVISGPNAGGKSITLKTVGLLQCMAQAGIQIPVDPESELPYFDKILTDIGDNQSIENHLSTYSYRLKKMNQFLKKCNRKTLFLIDEFGTGSDPELGGALAETFLEVFYEREAFGLITTHYANLKLLANELPFAMNANMQFDNRSLQPLFNLYLGEAGSSYTFEVAQKNGIPYSLINKAKKKIERGKIRFDKTIANLQRERSKLRKTSADLKSSEEKAKEESKLLEEINARVQHKLESYQELYDSNQQLIRLGRKVDKLAENYHNNKRKRQLLDELFKLVMVENSKRKQLSPTQKRKVKKQKAETLLEVEKEVAVIRKRKKKAKKQADKKVEDKPKIELKIGDRVRLIDGKAVGTIDTIEKNKAVVNYGIFTTNVSVDALEKA